MNIDDLLGNLHNDRVLTIEEQLRAIEREIMSRRLASAENSTVLFDQIRSLREQILSLEPPNPFMVDIHRDVRLPLEREHRELEREWRDELRQRLRDEADLKREQRALLREHTEEGQRYERHTGTYE